MTSTDPTAPETPRPVTRATDAPPPRRHPLFLSDDLRVHCLRAIGLVGVVLGAGVVLNTVRFYLTMTGMRLWHPVRTLAYLALGVFLLLAATAALRNRPHAYRYLRIYGRLGIAYAFLSAVSTLLTAVSSSWMALPTRIVEGLVGVPTTFCHNVAVPLLVLLLLRHPALKGLAQDSPPGFEVIRPATPHSADAPSPLPVQKL